MAQIKRIVRESPISNFQQGAPQGGGAFRLLAEGLNEIYDRVAPVAEEEMKQRGASLGREAARAQFGDDRPYKVSPQTQRTATSGGDDTLAGSAGSDELGVGNRNEAYRNAIASIESRGSGDYRAVGPTHSKLGRALGRYQIMEANIGPWSKEALGRTVTADEFLADDEIQDAIFDHKFGGYVSKFGEEGAAQAWFAGPGGVGKTSRKDSLGTSVGVYGDKFRAALSGGEIFAGGGQEIVSGSDGSGSDSAPYVAPTMVRTSSGALESRLYSPYSGPILQAHNAAARVAYQSEVLNKSAVDLMDMSNQFPLDPDGFSTAAEQYMDAIVDSAPTDYQGELRGVLQKEVQRRMFGMMEEKHRDIRNRANNSSRALVDRWSDNLTDALLTGDPDQIAAAQGELDGLLQAREALPGVSWTTEQSANIIIDARKRAVAEAERRRKVASVETKDKLNLIIKGAKSGATVADEGILDDPAAIADHPELAREAAAFVALRDNMPDFMEMTPADQAAAVADLAVQEVSEEWQLDLVDAARKSAKANKKAWDADPVQRASEVMKSNPPPALPELTPDDPEKMISGLTERREYMNQIREQGYTDTKAFLSESEAEGLQSVMGVDTPPELRAAIAGAIVAGFGPDAIAVFDEIDADSITMYAGKMLALGGNQALASTILRGQQILDEGLVRVPPKAARIEVFSTTTATAFEGVPGAADAQAEIMATAQAIYAADPSARGMEPTDEAAKELMNKSIQTALGQSKNKRGELLGGVQEILGNPTLLPIGVSGVQADQVLRDALIGKVKGGSSFERGMNALTGGLFGADVTETSEVWGDNPPMFNGKPVPPSYITGGRVRMVPAGANGYRLEITSGNARLNVEDKDGNVFFFDLPTLMEASE